MLKKHRDAASDLQEIGALKHWRVSLMGNDTIELSKVYGLRRVYAHLIRRDDGTYDLQPVDYEFKPKLSFFNYQQPERRLSRNQIFISSVFRLLRDANMWDIIANRDTYIHVNEDNVHIHGRKKEIGARLKALILDAKLVKTRKHTTLASLKGLKNEHRKARRQIT